MAIGLSSLIFVLEEGQREEWFNSHLIVAASIAAFIGIALFLIAELTTDKPFINLRLFANPGRRLGHPDGGVRRDRLRLGLSDPVLPGAGPGLQRPADRRGGDVERHPAALPAAAHAVPDARVDLRLLVGLGLILFAVSCFINVDMSPDTAMDQLMLPQLLRAAGQPLATIPLTQLSVVGLTRRDTADLAGITSVMRNLGASVGIAMLSTVVQIREQVHFSVIAEAMSRNSLRLQERLQDLAGMFAGHGADIDTARQQGIGMLAQQVRESASVMAYADSFWILGVCIVVSLLTLLILRKPPAGAAAMAADAH